MKVCSIDECEVELNIRNTSGMCRRHYKYFSNRRWAEANPDKLAVSKKKWEEENPEKVRANQRRWDEQNREKVRESCRNWRAANPQMVRAGKARRRAILKGATVEPLPTYYYEQVMRYYNYQCLKCGNRRLLHLDHVIPLAKGGLHAWLNFQVLCRTCNTSKGAHTSADYRGNNILMKVIVLKGHDEGTNLFLGPKRTGVGNLPFRKMRPKNRQTWQERIDI